MTDSRGFFAINQSINQSINQRGFGIVEVLIAIGLVGIMSVGITGVLTGAMKQQMGIQAKDQQREITSEIRTLLNNKSACLNSFGGQNPQTGFTALSIKDALSVVRYSVGANDKTGRLVFTEFKIDGWVADAGYTTQGNSDLKVKLSKNGDTGTSKEIRPDVITLKIKRDVAGNITECFSIGTSSDGFWQASPANISNVYYSGGNVGIGTNAPAAKLEVSGEVKISNSGVACSLANEGSQRYNSVLKIMEFCNGTTWGNVAAPSAASLPLAGVTGKSCSQVCTSSGKTCSQAYSSTRSCVASNTYRGGNTICTVTAMTAAGFTSCSSITAVGQTSQCFCN